MGEQQQHHADTVGMAAAAAAAGGGTTGAVAAGTTAAIAGAFGVPSPVSHCSSHGVSKRQRRPNVRLGEIGDRPLATVLEIFFKRTKQRGGGSRMKPTVARLPTASKQELLPSLVQEKDEVRQEEACRNSAPKASSDQLKKGGNVAKASEFSSSGPGRRTKRNLAGVREVVTTRKFFGKNRRIGMRRHGRNAVSRSLKKPSNLRMLLYKEATWRGTATEQHMDASADVLGSSERRNLDGASIESVLDGDHDLGQLRDNKRKHSHRPEESNPNSLGWHREGIDSLKRNTTSKINRNSNIISSPNVDGSPNIGRDTEREASKAASVEAFPVHVPPSSETHVAPPVSEVKDWLNSLGLAKYACIFQHHEVDRDVLPFLTMDDLREMEISAVGARRKMFCEIQKLRQGQAPDLK